MQGPQLLLQLTLMIVGPFSNSRSLSVLLGVLLAATRTVLRSEGLLLLNDLLYRGGLDCTCILPALTCVLCRIRTDVSCCWAANEDTKQLPGLNGLMIHRVRQQRQRGLR
jgi:hypothetical protein